MFKAKASTVLGRGILFQCSFTVNESEYPEQLLSET